MSRASTATLLWTIGVFQDRKGSTLVEDAPHASCVRKLHPIYSEAKASSMASTFSIGVSLIMR